MSRLGWADIGIATLNDMTANAEMIANLDTSVPLIADADTGYGGPVMVSRTVANYARAGVAALHIEDQIHEKRCGFLKGKEVVPREVWYSRLRAAVNARKQMGSDIIIIGRTDARQNLGFDECIERLNEAVRIGIDVVFIDAIKTKEECKKACEIMGNTPVMFNMCIGAGSPDLTVEEAKELGFRIIIFPGVCSSMVLASCKESLALLKSEGKEEMRGSGGVQELFMTCGLGTAIDIDQKAGGKAYDNDII
ncbi:Pyruvate/Phosphoenolpyruvate kinase-like domain-containing protein [Exophiala viscosa]|nr:Pyruvate/Phosphoenolpyruvate kinase-like domain-containing protein [Exophiala viscosa]